MWALAMVVVIVWNGRSILQARRVLRQVQLCPVIPLHPQVEDDDVA